MINLTIGSTIDVYLTLTEKETLTLPNYLFRFIQRTTNDEIKFVRLNNQDTSAYQDRYNKFSFVVNTLFPNAKIGEYEYYVYEQASTTNTDVALTGNLLEQGIMRLNPATGNVYTFTTYDTDNTFVTR